MCLNRNIRYLRKNRDMSQDTLAEMLGYKSYTTIQKWEMGVSEPPVKQLRRMAEIFNVDIDDMAKVDMEKIDLNPEKPEAYYTNPETTAIAQAVFDNPSLRALFDAARDVSPENIALAAEMLKRFKETNPNG